MPDKPARSAPAETSADAPPPGEGTATTGPAKTGLHGKGGTAKPADKNGGKAKKPPRKPGRSAKRTPPRQTFLVAATLAAGDGPPRLRVYAAVVRGPAEALAAVRAVLGPDASVELTGKLSNRTAKALGLEPGEVRLV